MVIACSTIHLAVLLPQNVYGCTSLRIDLCTGGFAQYVVIRYYGNCYREAKRMPCTIKANGLAGASVTLNKNKGNEAK